jgi:hypothetical protein
MFALKQEICCSFLPHEFSGNGFVYVTSDDPSCRGRNIDMCHIGNAYGPRWRWLTAFWNAALCILIHIGWRFSGTYCLLPQGDDGGAASQKSSSYCTARTWNLTLRIFPLKKHFYSCLRLCYAEEMTLNYSQVARHLFTYKSNVFRYDLKFLISPTVISAFYGLPCRFLTTAIL